MIGSLLRLTAPTIAVQLIGDESHALVIPPGATIRICGEALSDSRMLHVEWENKLLMMFKLDLRERGEEIRNAHVA